MEVLCACDQCYLPHAATMLCSLLQHNTVSRIHLFYSAIASAELAKLQALTANYRVPISFYDMAAADLRDLRVDSYISTAAYYRIFASDLLPPTIDKILYLDSDIIVRRSLRDLWNTDLSGCVLGAVSDCDGQQASQTLGLPAGTKYFNSGVLLINLEYWKRNNVGGRALAFARANPAKIQYHDQDALNATLVDQWIELPEYWNAQRAADWNGKDPAIVHFFVFPKPWQWSCQHPFKREYRKYRLKTPWRRYREEGRPSPLRRFGYFLRSFARAVLPGSVRQRLRQYACRLGLRK